MKPLATLTIISRGASTSYLLHAAGVLVWNTRASSTSAGTDGARERLRQWLVARPYKVVLAEQQRRTG